MKQFPLYPLKQGINSHVGIYTNKINRLLLHVTFGVSLSLASLARGFASLRPGMVNGNGSGVVVEAARVEVFDEDKAAG